MSKHVAVVAAALTELEASVAILPRDIARIVIAYATRTDTEKVADWVAGLPYVEDRADGTGPVIRVYEFEDNYVLYFRHAPDSRLEWHWIFRPDNPRKRKHADHLASAYWFDFDSFISRASASYPVWYWLSGLWQRLDLGNQL